MKGFDRKYRDFPHYVMGVTRELWERRRFAEGPPQYHHPQLIQRDAQRLSIGHEAVRQSAAEALAVTPDLRLLSEDVIWSGNDRLGYLGSHRILCEGTHMGAGRFGAATGQRLRYRVMRDVSAKENRISEIWQIGDTAALCAQTGMTVEDWARTQLSGLDPDSQPFRPEIDGPGPYTGKGNDNQWGTAFSEILAAVMAGNLAILKEQYDPACHLDYPGGVPAHGVPAAEAFWLGLRQSFPDATFKVCHSIGLGEPLLPPRAALRWRLDGRHTGWGPFGAPSGAQIHVMGISHAEFGPWGLRREWTLIDEGALWLQILAARG